MLDKIDTIEMNINNSRVMQLAQQGRDKNITFTTYDLDSGIVDCEKDITACDFVMLMNYYRYVKDNNIQCDFINPKGEVITE